MLLQFVSRPSLSLGARVLSTTSRMGRSNDVATAAASASKRDDYYKSLGEYTDESRPVGWENARPFSEIPGPQPLPLVGNVWRFLPVIGELHKIPIQKMFLIFKERYGNISILKGIFGRNPVVYLYDPKDMETLLRNCGPFPERYILQAMVHYRTVVRKDVFKDFGGILTVQGEEWFKMRSIVNPIMMQPRTVHQYVSKMDKISRQLVENMRHFKNLDKDAQMPENFLDELYKWSLESIGVVALNKHFGCLDLNLPEDSDPKKLVNAVLTMFDHLYHLEVTPPLWRYFPTPLYKKFVKNLDFITEVAMKNIDEALSEPIDESVPEHQQSVLQRLAKKNKEVAIAMVTDMLVAGIDTTGKTMGAILYFLARNPDKQAKLREEILKNLPHKDSPVTIEVLANLPYLKAAIKESNRIAPVAVGNLRRTPKDLVLGGYQIPKGSDVTVVTIYTSNAGEHFKDAEKYLPERWLRDTSDEYSYKNTHSFASMPFGYGPRSCVGKRFATLELEVALINIIRNFELSWHHKDMHFNSGLLYGVGDPLKLTVKELDG